MSSDKVKRIAADALLCALAMIFTYVEAVIPISSLVMLPAFRLGLANIAVMCAAFFISPVDALAVALAKCLLSAVLFQTPTAFIFSVSGTLLSLIVMCALSLSPKNPFSFIGISVLSAAAHNIGQIAAAYIMLGAGVISYLGYLLVVSAVCGVITGLIMNALTPSLLRMKINKNGAI